MEIRKAKADYSILDHAYSSKTLNKERVRVPGMSPTKQMKYRNTVSAACKNEKHTVCSKLDCPCECHAN